MFWPNTHIIHRRKVLARNPFKGGAEIKKLARNERAHGGAKPPPKRTHQSVAILVNLEKLCWL